MFYLLHLNNKYKWINPQTRAIAIVSKLKLKLKLIKSIASTEIIKLI